MNLNAAELRKLHEIIADVDHPRAQFPGHTSVGLGSSRTTHNLERKGMVRIWRVEGDGIGAGYRTAPTGAGRSYAAAHPTERLVRRRRGTGQTRPASAPAAAATGNALPAVKRATLWSVPGDDSMLTVQWQTGSATSARMGTPRAAELLAACRASGVTPQKRRGR